MIWGGWLTIESPLLFESYNSLSLFNNPRASPTPPLFALFLKYSARA
jgi:hypothetical protein